MGFLKRIMLGAVAASCCVVAARAGPSDALGGQDGPCKDHKQSNNGRGLAELEVDIETTPSKISAATTGTNIVGNEGALIKNNYMPFQQAPEDWGKRGKGISMDSTGEPKSGTTWMQRVITDLAVFLCGNEANKWCKMGGLKVIPSMPDASYIWELLHADTGEVFLHFDDGYFRAKILEGSTSMAVVFRDPRDVVISSHRYRTQTVVVEKHFVEPNLLDYIDHYFEIIVAWQHQRWVWHTTFYREASYVMFYEDLKEKHLSLVGLAAFMGLDCSPEQARNVWERHIETKPHGGYDSYGMPTQKIEFMNDTMSRLLPVDMLARYGLTPVVF